METRHAMRHSTTIHTSPQNHDRKQARSETNDKISQRYSQIFVRLEPHHSVKKRNDGTCLVVVAQMWQETLQRAKVSHAIIAMHKELRSSTKPVFAQENFLGLAEVFIEHQYKVADRLNMDSDSARQVLQRKGPCGHKPINIR